MENFGGIPLIGLREAVLSPWQLWRKRLFERPSYKEAVEKWLNPKYLELFEWQRPAVRQRMSTM